MAGLSIRLTRFDAPMNNNTWTHAPQLRLTIAISAGLNLLIGLAFLFGPELGITLWPSPLLLNAMHFAGFIVLTNGIGAALIIWHSIWKHPRVLLAVAVVYSLAIFLGLFFNVFANGAPPVLWTYLAINTLLLIPAAYFLWRNERTR